MPTDTLSAEKRLNNYLDSLTTPVLVETMQMLTTRRDDGDTHAEVALLATYGVLEKRHPEADQIMDSFYSDESEEGIAFVNENNYTQTLIIALKTAGVV